MVAGLLLLACASQPSLGLAAAFRSGLQLVLASDEGGPPPGSPYPPPPPLVQDPPPPTPSPGIARGTPAPAPRPGAEDAGARLLWGVGLHLGGGQDQMAVSGSNVGTSGFLGPGSAATAGIGAYLRVGAAASDRWGIDGEISAGTIFADSYVRGALTADVSFGDGLTIALGPLVRDDAIVESCSCGQTTVSVTSVGATARIDLHVDPSRDSHGRGALTVGLAGDLGATTGANGFCGNERFAGPGIAYAAYLTLGYMRY